MVRPRAWCRNWRCFILHVSNISLLSTRSEHPQLYIFNKVISAICRILSLPPKARVGYLDFALWWLDDILKMQAPK